MAAHHLLEPVSSRSFLASCWDAARGRQQLNDSNAYDFSNPTLRPVTTRSRASSHSEEARLAAMSRSTSQSRNGRTKLRKQPPSRKKSVSRTREELTAAPSDDESYNVPTREEIRKILQQDVVPTSRSKALSRPERPNEELLPPVSSTGCSPAIVSPHRPYRPQGWGHEPKQQRRQAQIIDPTLNQASSAHVPIPSAPRLASSSARTASHQTPAPPWTPPTSSGHHPSTQHKIQDPAQRVQPPSGSNYIPYRPRPSLEEASHPVVEHGRRRAFTQGHQTSESRPLAFQQAHPAARPPQPVPSRLPRPKPQALPPSDRAPGSHSISLLPPSLPADSDLQPAPPVPRRLRPQLQSQPQPRLQPQLPPQPERTSLLAKRASARLLAPIRTDHRAPTTTTVHGGTFLSPPSAIPSRSASPTPSSAYSAASSSVVALAPADPPPCRPLPPRPPTTPSSSSRKRSLSIPRRNIAAAVLAPPSLPPTFCELASRSPSSASERSGPTTPGFAPASAPRGIGRKASTKSVRGGWASDVDVPLVPRGIVDSGLREMGIMLLKSVDGALDDGFEGGKHGAEYLWAAAGPATRDESVDGGFGWPLRTHTPGSSRARQGGFVAAGGVDGGWI